MSDDVRTRKEIVSDFNKRTFSLLTIVEKKAPKSSASRIKRQITIAKGYDHEVLITTMGVKLYNFSDDIYDKKLVNSFTKEIFDKEIEKVKKEAAETGVSINTDDIKMAYETFDIVMQCKKCTTEEEFNEIYVILEELIDDYITFCIRCKSEAKK
jgi:hypothetical protein